MKNVGIVFAAVAAIILLANRGVPTFPFERDVGIASDHLSELREEVVMGLREPEKRGRHCEMRVSENMWDVCT